jgi:hypothetical protein
MIWHVDDSVCVLEAPNYDPKHFFLTVKESDGREDLQRDMTVLLKEEDVDKVQKDLAGDEGDPFPGRNGNRNFDDESTPNSRSYSGNKSLVKVASISDSTDLMKAEMGVEFQPRRMGVQYSSDKNSSEVVKKGKISQEITYKQFITLISALPKVEDPYGEGYEAAKKDFLEEFKENGNLNFYQDGYRRGYRHGYKKVIKKLEK